MEYAEVLRRTRNYYQAFEKLKQIELDIEDELEKELEPKQSDLRRAKLLQGLLDNHLLSRRARIQAVLEEIWNVQWHCEPELDDLPANWTD